MQKPIRGTGGAEGSGLGHQIRNGTFRQRRTTESAIPSLKPLECQHRIAGAQIESSARTLYGARYPPKPFIRPILLPGPWDGQLRCPGCATGSMLEPTSGSGRRIIQFGIEAEFEIAAYVPKYSLEKLALKNFVKIAAENYNKQVYERHPQMREGLRPSSFRGPYDQWCLALDPTVKASQESFCKPFPFRPYSEITFEGHS